MNELYDEYSRILVTRACNESVDGRQTPRLPNRTLYREGSLLPGVIRKVEIDELRKGVTDKSVHHERLVGPVHGGHAEEVVNPGRRDVPSQEKQSPVSIKRCQSLAYHIDTLHTSVCGAFHNIGA